ncbi:MAG: isochorismatase family protein [Lentimicrobiaceae bacterium]|jgi:nicotinamidase-related amidase|nr:isochorismatase family protein [Lentimicrobiaceae bacterium]
MKKLLITFTMMVLTLSTFAQKEMKPALLVIDTQNEFLKYMCEEDKKAALEYINYAIMIFREKNLPVIRVYHTDPGFGPAPGTEAFEYPSSISIKDTDPKVIKNYGNAFKKTDLDKILKEKGINTVYLCGLSATACVLATYFGAKDNEYDAFMIKDALLSPDATHTKTIEQITETVSINTMYFMLNRLK